LGLVSGVFLLVVGLSGSLLVFHAEIDAAAHPRVVTLAREGPRLPHDVLLARLHEQLPGHEVVGWVPARHPGHADPVRVRARGESHWQLAYVNSITGEVQGGARDFDSTVSGWLLELHYGLHAGTPGVVFVGLLGLALVLTGLTGIVLARGRLARLLNPFRFRQNLRILASDLHKTVGWASVAFNLLLGGTGAYWNLQSVPDLFAAENAEEASPPTRLYADTLSWDRLVERSREALPGFEPGYLTFPREPGADIVVRGRVPGANPLWSPISSSVRFDAWSGELREVNDIRDADLWTQVQDMMMPLHFGDFGGLPVKVLWFLAGLAPGALALTGTVIFLRRRMHRAQG
jgi:uncharacterized iron-regulated membrane protein